MLQEIELFNKAETNDKYWSFKSTKAADLKLLPKIGKKIAFSWLLQLQSSLNVVSQCSAWIYLVHVSLKGFGQIFEHIKALVVLFNHIKALIECDVLIGHVLIKSTFILKKRYDLHSFFKYMKFLVKAFAKHNLCL